MNSILYFFYFVEYRLSALNADIIKKVKQVEQSK